MKLVINTQYRENYGSHDWDGKGECPQYWKFKGGSTYVVPNILGESPDILKRVRPLIEYGNYGSEEYILDYSIVENNAKVCESWESVTQIFITEDKKSTLKSIQEEEKLLFSPHPNSIGGRYSVFSIVGLLPAKVVNFNIKSFCDGAKYFLKDLASSKNFDYYFLPIFNLIKLNEKGINMSIMMPYYDSLNSLSLWYRQLWAESIGKNGKGITPINSLGTVDQHSQLQLYLDGPRDKFFTIIGKKKEEKNMKMDCRYAKSKIFDSLHNKSLETLLNAEMNATIQTMKNKKLPMRVLTLDSLSENFMGSLMMFFFLETIFSCFLLDLNPFDQPAVEEGKKLTKIFLKKDE